jgi:hypothetical protein
MFTNTYFMSAHKRPLKLSSRKSDGRKTSHSVNHQVFFTVGGVFFGIFIALHQNDVTLVSTLRKQRLFMIMDL